MPRSIVLFIVLVGCLGLVGCSDGGKLSAQMAGSAISQWDKSNAGVTVTGIQEIPQQNMAKADVQFSHLKYNNNGSHRDYSGPGEAVFTHYNDGRWVLTNITIKDNFYDHMSGRVKFEMNANAK